MTSPLRDLDKVVGLHSLEHLSPADAVELLGSWVDLAWDQRRRDVLRHLTELAKTIVIERTPATDQVLLDFYLGNAWNGLKMLRSPDPGGTWEWEQEELEEEYICLRRAIRAPGFQGLPRLRQCQITTNLANCHNTTGRFVEAVGVWDDALGIAPDFGMALGNRAVGFWTYAKAVYDDGHGVVLARRAWRDLDPDTLTNVEPGADQYFEQTRRDIETALPLSVLEFKTEMDGYSLGDCDDEQEYRAWCLKERLFLSPLNDLGAYAIAARDVLNSPSIVAPLDQGPRFHGFFNQIKQEYCSARWLVFESLRADTPHFADRDVLLFNTLDYPSYSLATEKAKLAFRALYALFDKMAFLLNAYLALGIPERRVSFRGLWYKGQSRANGLRDEFVKRNNWPLRGLFWVGKDLFEDRSEFRASIEPDSERLSEIRNHLEHKYVKLHQDPWCGPDEDPLFVDDLALSIGRDEFNRMTMRLSRLVRAAFTYLSLGVHSEERLRAAARPRGAITPPMHLGLWEDDWKR